LVDFGIKLVERIFSQIIPVKSSECVSPSPKEHGIDSILVSRGCVSIYSQNRYQSYDLDYVTY